MKELQLEKCPSLTYAHTETERNICTDRTLAIYADSPCQCPPIATDPSPQAPCSCASCSVTCSVTHALLHGACLFPSQPQPLLHSMGDEQRETGQGKDSHSSVTLSSVSGQAMLPLNAEVVAVAEGRAVGCSSQIALAQRKGRQGAGWRESLWGCCSS